jgi:hypothetical protein
MCSCRWALEDQLDWEPEEEQEAWLPRKVVHNPSIRWAQLKTPPQRPPGPSLHCFLHDSALAWCAELLITLS